MVLHNGEGLKNLQNKKVPLYLATHYNLCFGQLSEVKSGGYNIAMGLNAAQVKEQITTQAPGVKIYAGLNDGGIKSTVVHNRMHNNRSTINIVKWLKANGYGGISIDAEKK